MYANFMCKVYKARSRYEKNLALLRFQDEIAKYTGCTIF